MNAKWKVKDHYFLKAKKENRLARSSYKLEEIDKKFRVIRPGDKVLDIGYFPGSWTQYALSKVGKSGLLVGIDIKPVNNDLLRCENIKLFEKDIFELNNLEDIGLNSHFNVVVSDMAPNTVGVRSVDQAKSFNLTEAIFDILPKFLKMSGNLVIKFFDSHETQSFLKSQKGFFSSLKFFRPKSTRPRSKELFFIGKNYLK